MKEAVHAHKALKGMALTQAQLAGSVAGAKARDLLKAAADPSLRIHGASKSGMVCLPEDGVRE